MWPVQCGLEPVISLDIYTNDSPGIYVMVSPVVRLHASITQRGNGKQYRPAHDGAALLVAPLLGVVVGSEVLLTTYCACALSTTAPVDGEAAPALLGPAHGGEQEDVEDDEGDAGQHLHEDHAEPAQTHSRYSVQINCVDIVCRYIVCRYIV